jgi:hypothetical protein
VHVHSREIKRERERGRERKRERERENREREREGERERKKERKKERERDVYKWCDLSPWHSHFLASSYDGQAHFHTDIRTIFCSV